MEDKPVGDRLIKIWPNIKIVNFWLSLSKSKRPSSKSFESIKTAVENPLTTAKLSFFSYFASLFQPFLKKYQTSKPMVPYLYQDLIQLVRSLLGIVVKNDVLEKCTTVQQLIKINLGDKDTFKTKREELNLGFATESIIKQLVKKDSVQKNAVRNFVTNVQTCVVGTVNKIFERTPLGSIILSTAAIFNPESIMNSTNGTLLLKKLKLLLQHLVSLKLIPAHHADKAFAQFPEFISNEMKLVNGSEDIDRLDDFYFKEAKIGVYPELASVLKIILTLSHGQADVERGFSLNKSSLQTNINENSVVGKRLVKDHMLANNLKPHEIVFTSQLRKSCRLAHSRYIAHLEDMREKKEKNKVEDAKQVMDSEIKNIKSQISDVEKTCNLLDEKFVKLVQVAEQKQDMNKITEANALKRKCEEKDEDKKKLEEALKILAEKWKNL